MTLPPDGAARQVGRDLWAALEEALPPDQRKLFDTKLYLDGFDRLLKDPVDDMVVDLVNQALVVQALDFRATHLLVLALSPVTRFTARLLRRQGILTAHWFYEDFRQAKYWRDVLPAYDAFLAIQRGPVETACREAGTTFRYLPTAAAADNGPLRPWKERVGGLVFVGFPSVYRVSLLESLLRAGLPLKVAGAGWEAYRGPLQACLQGSGWAGPEKVRALLQEAKVGLHIPAEDPGADRVNCHVSPRIFDVLASGALLLCEEAPLVRETLRGMVYRGFRGVVELPEAARAALSEGLPEAAQIRNREAVLRDHGYRGRLREIFSLEKTETGPEA